MKVKRKISVKSCLCCISYLALSIMAILLVLFAYTFHCLGRGSDTEKANEQEYINQWDEPPTAEEIKRVSEWFTNEGSTFTHIDGSCVAWLDLGHCEYFIASTEALKPRQELGLKQVSCDEVIVGERVEWVKILLGESGKVKECLASHSGRELFLIRDDKYGLIVGDNHRSFFWWVYTF